MRTETTEVLIVEHQGAKGLPFCWCLIIALAVFCLLCPDQGCRWGRVFFWEWGCCWKIFWTAVVLVFFNSGSRFLLPLPGRVISPSTAGT